MGRVQRDEFETSSDHWLAARSALLELFSSATVDESHPVATEPLVGVPAQLRNADTVPTDEHVLDVDQQQRLSEHLGEDAVERLALHALPDHFKLSVVVPVFNEATTIEQVLRRLINFPLPFGSHRGRRRQSRRISQFASAVDPRLDARPAGGQVDATHPARRQPGERGGVEDRICRSDRGDRGDPGRRSRIRSARFCVVARALADRPG